MNLQTQIIVFLKNAPGELSKLCEVLRARDINILAMSIQNAEDYLRGLFKAREITGRRIAPAANYGSVIRDSEDYSVIRFLVEQDQTDETISVLKKAKYPIETTPVLIIILDNEPGMLGGMAGTFARAGINIDYVYGSGVSGTDKALYVVHVKEEDLEQASRLFPMSETWGLRPSCLSKFVSIRAKDPMQARRRSHCRRLGPLLQPSR